ncbi:MAG: hypothetical protein Hyperionvirus1_94 [Hyperionvirus sp.]|uniref:Uncharacterized protein n=1 Tax=Hyperionvirus sp. TaxID=2487770 RepID=A0A3G5A5J3_9VIRU|nr:MAG: hypothetical protein Hyperionvirus1_94 [Hyperionvirus sp.]
MNVVVRGDMSLFAFGAVEWKTDQSGFRSASIIPALDMFGNLTVMDDKGCFFKVPSRFRVASLSGNGEPLIPMIPMDHPPHMICSKELVSRSLSEGRVPGSAAAAAAAAVSTVDAAPSGIELGQKRKLIKYEPTFHPEEKVLVKLRDGKFHEGIVISATNGYNLIELPDKTEWYSPSINIKKIDDPEMTAAALLQQIMQHDIKRQKILDDVA